MIEKNHTITFFVRISLQLCYKSSTYMLNKDVIFEASSFLQRNFN